MLQPMWRRRRRTPTGDERSAADHIDLLSIARTVVQEVRAQPNDPHGGDLEDIEVVHVLHGQDMDQAREPGILMTWHQGQNVFGLLTPMGRLIHQAGGVETVSVYLRLAIDEPHGATPNRSRLWFLDLPSGPY